MKPSVPWSPAWGSVWPPFWRTSVMEREGAMLIRPAGTATAEAPLLFATDAVREVRMADGNTIFEEGRDYVLAPDRRAIRLTAESRIPWLEEASLYPAKGRPHAMAHRRDAPEVHLLFSEGSFFHDQQVQVTYSHSETWTGAPMAGVSPLLPKTRGRLAERQPLKVAVGGDSISAGFNASGKVGAAPWMPAYPEAFAAVLESETGAPIRLVNRAVAGWNSEHGLNDLPALLETAPDLVILAYGMNDVAQTPPELFRERMQTMIARVHAARPEAEIILVSPMLGNPLWVWTPAERFPVIRDILASLTGPGVALADLTQLWADLLCRKRYLDLSGNGLNHPNDFGHRLYAQVFLDLLIGARDTELEYEMRA